MRQGQALLAAMTTTAQPPALKLPRAALLGAAIFLLLLAGCQAKSSSESPDSLDSPVHLSIGATRAQARDEPPSALVLQSTPDLVLHADLRDATYEGKTLLIQGTDPHGVVAWKYPHLQKGTSFDAVLPVFGSPAARKHELGTYSFQVLAPDRSRVIAAGVTTFTSAPSSVGSAGASAPPVVAAAKKE